MYVNPLIYFSNLNNFLLVSYKSLLLFKNDLCLIKLYKLEHYINGLTYTSPFDNEDIILDRLIQLCDYLSLYFPNNSILKEYVEADISHIPLSSIIKKIINL